MSTTLDLDDVAATSPLAKEELIALRQKIDAANAENERLRGALLKVRIALGLHRDSPDDLVSAAEKLRTELASAITQRDLARSDYTRDRVRMAEVIAAQNRTIAAEAELAAIARAKQAT